MTDQDIAKIVQQAVTDAVGQSHNAVAKVQSNAFGELKKEMQEVKTELAVLKVTSQQTLEQATKTNGRTTRNEEKINLLNTKMAYVYGGIALLSALGVSNLVTWAGV